MHRLKKSTVDVQKAYQTIENTRRRYGKLQKAEIHFHTPASHDYELIQGKDYKQLTIKEILDYSVELSMFTEEEKSVILTKYQQGEYSGSEYLDKLSEIKAPYDDFNEYISYSLIAHKLYKESINIAVITDHNTIKGFHKLKFALHEYYNRHEKHKTPRRKPIYLFLGVEISCSDHTHVVGIFNENNYEELNLFLNEIIYSEESGTIETSHTILQEINLRNGIGYIAHVNSYQGIGTGLYKRSLFTSPYTKILGLTNLDSDAWKSKTFPSFNDDGVCYLFESDAHSLDKMGIQNTWIKMNEISFSSLVKSINNHSFCIYHSKPQTTSTYIKGLYLEPGSTGFLKGTNENDAFIVDFSKDLNCIIGGRGTGKSTILNILDTAFTREAIDLNTLRFISLYEYVYILFSWNSDDYILRFFPQANQNLDQSHPDFFLSDAFNKTMNQLSSKIHLNKNWYDLYKVVDRKKPKEIRSTFECETILNNVFKKHYSINNLINMVQNKKIGDFIKEVIYTGETNNFFNEEIRKLFNVHPKDFNKTIKTSLKELQDKLDEFKKDAVLKIDDFNKQHHRLIQVEYEPKRQSPFKPFLEDLFKGIDPSDYIASTLLKWEDFSDYTYRITEKITTLEFLNLLFNRKFNDLNDIEPIKRYISSELTIKDIQYGYRSIEEVPIKDIYGEVLNRFRKQKNNVVDCINSYIKSVDDYTINFNINSKASIENLPLLFKNIEHLSLGQQVVAILTFIIEYGKYCGDNTPLIIDQPEDNLDNQYIFNNLVKSLRNIKNHRQVIIVTHNSSIVTNADAEQVIVLESNGLNGTIRKKGYLSDKAIMKLILVHLEGGEEAFKNKAQSYSAILNFDQA